MDIELGNPQSRVEWYLEYIIENGSGDGGGGDGRFISGWDSTTGMPTPDLDPIPFSYRAGDFFVVKVAGAEGETNFRPTGNVYMGEASTEVEPEVVGESDFYFYTGSKWIHVANGGGGGGGGKVKDVQIDGVTILEAGIANIPLATKEVNGAMSAEDKTNLEIVVHPTDRTGHEVWGSDGTGNAEWKKLQVATYEYPGLMSNRDKIDFDEINTPDAALPDQVWTASGAGNAYWKDPKTVELGRLVGSWNCVRGLPDEDLLPFEYLGGDYFLVSMVADIEGYVNYRPTGTEYTGEPSEELETETVSVGDMYLYIGLNKKWELIPVGSSIKNTVKDVTVNGKSVVHNRIAEIPVASHSRDGVMSNYDKAKFDHIVSPGEADITKVWTATNDGGEWAYSSGGGGGDRVDFDEDENMIVDLGTMQPVVANPILDGTEPALKGLKVGDYRFRVVNGGGENPIDDIMVNGKTIVKDGVANIPLMSKDSTNKYGLISSDDYAGIPKVIPNPAGIDPIEYLRTITINDHSYHVAAGSVEGKAVEDIFINELSIVQEFGGSLYGYIPFHDPVGDPVPFGLISEGDYKYLRGAEQNLYKVPEITIDSDHAHYPSAKAVYDYIELNPEDTGEAYPVLNRLRIGNNIVKIGAGEGGGTVGDVMVQDPETGYWSSVVNEFGVANIPNYQLLEDKVTKLTENSTDYQYPSAKCVFDLVGNIEELLGDLL